MNQQLMEMKKKFQNRKITPVEFIESTYRVRDNKGVLNDYKLTRPHKNILTKGLLGDKSATSRIIDKGRQIGFSIFAGIEHLTISKFFPNTYIYYVATKEDQAKSWLRKVELLGHDARLWFDGSRLIDVDARKSSLLEKAIKHFPSKIKKEIEYSYICGLSSSPAGIRGETAIAIILDEFPQMTLFRQHQRKVYDAILYFISQGGQLTVQGTPLVRSDLFWDMFINAKKYLMTPFHCPTIENWEEIDLNKDLRTQRLKIPYWWSNIDLLESSRRTDLAYFKQEVLGLPADVMHRYIPPELVNPCIDSKEKDGNDNGGVYRVSADVAQKRDLSVFTVGELIEGHIYERSIYETQETYPKQFELLMKIFKKFKPMDFVIDNTGVGITLADMVENEPGTPPIKRVDFSSRVQLNERTVKTPIWLGMQFKKALTDKTYHLLDNQLAINHILRIEKTVTESGTERLSGKRDGKRDDHFWSKALLCANFDFNQAKVGFLTMPGSGLGVANIDSSRIEKIKQATKNSRKQTFEERVSNNETMLSW